MKKSVALRKRVLALIAALFLIAVLSVPAFADNTQRVVINGSLYFQNSVSLSDYLEVNTMYYCLSGSYTLYSGSNVVVASNLTGFKVNSSSTTGGYNYSLLALNQSTSILFADAVVADYEDATFTAYDGRYVVFQDFVVYYGSALYNFIRNVGSSTSSVNFSPLTAVNVVDILVGGFNGILSGFGSGTADFFETIFLNNDGSLTTFALVGLVFLGVGLSVGIARWVIKKVGQ